MGALTMELEKINRTNNEILKNQKKVDELTEKLEQVKQEKRTQKEYERDLKIACENDLFSLLSTKFEQLGYEKAVISLQLVATRQEIIKIIATTEFEHMYLNKNYERIYNRVKRIYENDKKAKESLIQSELTPQSIDVLNQNLEQIQSLEDIDVMVENKKNPQNNTQKNLQDALGALAFLVSLISGYSLIDLDLPLLSFPGVLMIITFLLMCVFYSLAIKIKSKNKAIQVKILTDKESNKQAVKQALKALSYILLILAVIAVGIAIFFLKYLLIGAIIVIAVICMAAGSK